MVLHLTTLNEENSHFTPFFLLLEVNIKGDFSVETEGSYPESFLFVGRWSQTCLDEENRILAASDEGEAGPGRGNGMSIERQWVRQA